MTQEITDRFFLEEILFRLCDYNENRDPSQLDSAITLARDIAQEYQNKYPLTETERKQYIEEIGVDD